jgi:hypothetical protein
MSSMLYIRPGNPHGYTPAERDQIQQVMRSHDRRLRDIENADERLVQLRGTAVYARAREAFERMVNEFKRMDGMIRMAWQRALAEKFTEEPIRTRTVELKSLDSAGLGGLFILIAIVVVAVVAIWGFIVVVPPLMAALGAFARGLQDFGRVAGAAVSAAAPLIVLLGLAVVVFYLVGRGRRALS